MKEKKPTCPLPPRNRPVLCLLNGGAYIVGTRRTPQTVYYDMEQPYGLPIPARWIKEWWDILPTRSSVLLGDTKIHLLRLVSHMLQGDLHVSKLA